MAESKSNTTETETEVETAKENTKNSKSKSNGNNRTHKPVTGLTIEELRTKTLSDLTELALGLNIENPNDFTRQDLMFEILKAQVTKGGYLLLSGMLEIMPDGYGFLRALDFNFSNSENDTYVSITQIKRFGLRSGDVVTGQVRPPKDKEKYAALLKIEAINYLPVEESKKRLLFDNLTPIFPNEQIRFEYDPLRLTGRITDLFAPVGKGQRGLIVAPPKSGKTEILKELAHGIEKNHPEVMLMVLLVDERPEEVTDMQRSVKGEVYSSTFDMPAQNHVRTAELVISKAKRLVEQGKDVVILLDSITRLARAYNTVTPSSGKVLSGGVDANALHKPKRFLGAARNIEGGGSLTIMSTALIETGSKMDEVIFEEFKGTGNMELILSRAISDKRIYPAVDVVKSGTRKEEILYAPGNLQKVWALRTAMSQMGSEIEALKFIYSKMQATKDNEEFLSKMNDG